VLFTVVFPTASLVYTVGRRHRRNCSQRSVTASALSLSLSLFSSPFPPQLNCLRVGPSADACRMQPAAVLRSLSPSKQASRPTPREYVSSRRPFLSSQSVRRGATEVEPVATAAKGPKRLLHRPSCSKERRIDICCSSSQTEAGCWIIGWA
jgi:hypothetical protein